MTLLDVWISVVFTSNDYQSIEWDTQKNMKKVTLCESIIVTKKQKNQTTTSQCRGNI